jgi:hypothetical protein
LKPRHQFNEGVIGLTEAVTALANYTRALKKISGNEAAIESRDAPDCISAVDILEKAAKQLARAANELRSLYACCGHADWDEAVYRVTSHHQGNCLRIRCHDDGTREEKPCIGRRSQCPGGESARRLA